MKRTAAGFLLVMLAGCSSAQQEVEPEPVVAPAPQQVVATDPRVGELQVVVAELLDRIEVMNARIHKLESGTQPSRPVQTASTQPEHSPTVAAQPVAEPVRPARVTPPRGSRVSGASLADQYRNALELYGKGHVDQSRVAFQGVYDADPNGELADNALYWIGETYFVTGKYTEANKYYQKIETDYSDQNKAPDAMLKMGLAYAKQGDLALARKTFQELIAKYPYSTPAAAAKFELKRIQY